MGDLQAILRYKLPVDRYQRKTQDSLDQLLGKKPAKKKKSSTGAQQTEATHEIETSAPAKPRRKGLAVALALASVLLIACGIGAYLYFGGDDADEISQANTTVAELNESLKEMKTEIAKLIAKSSANKRQFTAGAMMVGGGQVGETVNRVVPDTKGVIQAEGDYHGPKVMYVNLDDKARGILGERPWSRSFFAEVARILLERGNVRVVAFDLLFSRKSTSSMVDEEKVYRDNAVMGELIADFPDRVVLGAAYTGVSTRTIRKLGISSTPPLFKDGYDERAGSSAGKYHYPEAPTYPLQSYKDGEYLGRIGSFTMIPYRGSGLAPRWMPLWFPGGGKAHAYNVLGGKRMNLAFDLQQSNAAEIKELETELSSLADQRKATDAELASIAAMRDSLTKEETGLKEKLAGLKEELPGAPSEKLKAQIAELDQAIENLRKSLEANPAIAAVVEPQLKARQAEKAELVTKLADLEARALVVGRLADLKNKYRDLIDHGLNAKAAEDATRKRLDRLRPRVEDTELLETQNHLRLVYKRPAGVEGNGTLVESLPNEMPLNRNRRFYALGLEALLAYYGLDDEDVEISDDRERLRLMDKEGKVLIDVPLSEGQFVQVKWFSKWQEKIPEEENLREAQRLYAEEKYQEYVGLAPEIIRGVLSRVKGLQVPEGDAGLLKALADLGVEQDHVSAAEQLLKAANGELDAVKAPGLEDLRNLTTAIEYYFLPPTLESPFNPMCSMKDVLDFDRYLKQRETDLEKIDAMIAKIEGEYSPKIKKLLDSVKDKAKDEAKKDIFDARDSPLAKDIESLQSKLEELEQQQLNKDPVFSKILGHMNEMKAALKINQGEREKVIRELELLNSFFAKFKDAIVFIGPVAKILLDLIPTPPVDDRAVPKVSVHGNLVKTLVSGQ